LRQAREERARLATVTSAGLALVRAGRLLLLTSKEERLDQQRQLLSQLVTERQDLKSRGFGLRTRFDLLIRLIERTVQLPSLELASSMANGEYGRVIYIPYNVRLELLLKDGIRAEQTTLAHKVKQGPQLREVVLDRRATQYDSIASANLSNRL